MCGRYTLVATAEAIAARFGVVVPLSFRPRYNVAPTQQMPVIIEGDSDRELHMMRWGLIPHWAKDKAIGNKMINARAETVAEKPSFRSAFKRSRCLVPADGFYEWRSEAGGKQPYLFTMKDAALFSFAGLWERWHDPSSGEAVESCCIVTTEASPDLAVIHHRMPVILDPADRDTWLDPAASRPLLQALLKPYPEGAMTFRPVSRRLNKVVNDDPEVLIPETESDNGVAAVEAPRQGELF